MRFMWRSPSNAARLPCIWRRDSRIGVNRGPSAAREAHGGAPMSASAASRPGFWCDFCVKPRINTGMRTADPWGNALVCARAAQAASDPARRALLVYLGEFWLELARHDISQINVETAIDLAVIEQMQARIIVTGAKGVAVRASGLWRGSFRAGVGWLCCPGQPVAHRGSPRTRFRAWRRFWRGRGRHRGSHDRHHCGCRR
jgi:hypothetical protein